MSFIYPLGLLGLIAIPVLIIIYIIKNKYTEQVISSTYLWTLSEKFLKRKNPINRITGIISLILQILAVIFISFAIAHPVFVLPGAANDFLFILDGSGSMNITADGKTRLDKGKDEISSLIKKSADGSTYTLIFTADGTEVVFENLDDKERALNLLGEIEPAYTASGFTDALSMAQNYFNENSGVKTYLVTDKAYENCENATLINVSSNERNYALSQINTSLSGGKLVVDGTAYSYEDDTTVTVELFVNGEAAPVVSQQVELKKLEGAKFTLDGGDNSDYQSLRVAIKETDSLALDSEVMVYNVRNDSSYKTLIVSENKSFFIKTALRAIGNTQIDEVTPDKYIEAENGGYGLYVFDGFSPEVMPSDGAVWFINPKVSTEKSGFSVQSEVNEPSGLVLNYNQSSATRVKSLLKGVVRDDITLCRYVKCGLYRNFTTALSHDGNPVVFAGTNAYGNREVVFAFDISDSDIAMSVNFTTLVFNLISYTFPAVIDETVYYCGDTMLVNVLANCESIRLVSPSGASEYLDVSGDTCEYRLTEAGVYSVTMIIGNSPRVVNVFAQLPESERFTTVTEQSFVISGEATAEKRDGKYEDLIYLFIILAVIFIADWMVYCYEQYQLR